MSKQLPDIKSIVIKIITDKPVRKTAYQVKGVFMRKYPDEPIVPMLDGTYRNKFLYPRVQVKVLNEQIYLIGLHEAVDVVLSLSKNLKELDFGNITFEIEDLAIEENKNQCIVSNELFRYRFITPWVALNRMTGKKYRFLSNKDKPSFLSKLLGKNLLFLSNEFGVVHDKNIATKVRISNLSPKRIDEHRWGSFKGEFTTNFVIPNYIGIGNGITRGFGTVSGISDQNNSSSNKSELKLGTKDVLEEEGMEIISISDSINRKGNNKNSRIKKNKNTRYNKFRKKTARFKNKETHKNKRFKRNYQQQSNIAEANNGNIKKEEYDTYDDQRFNTERHHKKQHKF